MIPDLSKDLVEGLILAFGGFTTFSGIILAWRNRKVGDMKAAAEVGLDEATAAKIVRDAAHSVEEDYLARLRDFRAEISRLNQEVSIERQRAVEWRERLTTFEDFFFTKHMPWDRRMCVLAREHDWAIDDPPSIIEYVREMQTRMDSFTMTAEDMPEPT